MLRGFVAEALKASWMSLVEKESLRGSESWVFDGRGIVSVMVLGIACVGVCVRFDCFAGGVLSMIVMVRSVKTFRCGVEFDLRVMIGVCAVFLGCSNCVLRLRLVRWQAE